MSERRVAVIGAGLAGCEAADRLTRHGIAVDLFEMKPQRRSPAHRRDGFAELVCSNSLRSDRLENAVGLLKQEMRLLDSLILRCADATRVPAGGALAVDREGFSRLVTQQIRSNPLICVHEGEVTELPPVPAIIATGPLTSDALSARISALVGGDLHFYDAAAPVVTYDSLDHDRVFRASRYERGADYLNCPMTREEYFAFYRAWLRRRRCRCTRLKRRACLRAVCRSRSWQSAGAYAGLWPHEASGVGGAWKAAVCRSATASGRCGRPALEPGRVSDQSAVRRTAARIWHDPGLAHAEYARYGVMHRNTFLPSPGKLDCRYQLKARPACSLPARSRASRDMWNLRQAGCWPARSWPGNAANYRLLRCRLRRRLARSHTTYPAMWG